MLGILLSGLLLEVFWWGSVQLAYGGAAVAVAAVALHALPASRNPDLAVDVRGGLLALVGLPGLVLGVDPYRDEPSVAPAGAPALR